jgi:AraC-like DNA-binding protein
MWLTEQNRIRLARAREMLAAANDAELSIAEIARELGLSPFHFIRRFEAVFGVTPHQFRIERRIDRAKTLLASGQYSVTDVCLEVGFSSLGSFSALFARRVGETPSAYRRRVRAAVAVPGLVPPLAPGCLTLLAYLPRWAFRNFREAPGGPAAHDGVVISRSRERCASR